MDEGNVFNQLRRIARKVQNETALAEERMRRPTALRASGDSARPVLRRMLGEARDVRIATEETQSNLPATSDFTALLESCNQLCDAYRSKVNVLENYLQQYGYQVQQSVKSKGPAKGLNEKATSLPKSSSKDDKLSFAQADASSTEGLEEMKENIPVQITPTKNPELSSSNQQPGARTPRPEDYGLSRDFLDQMTRNKHQEPTKEGATLNSTFNRRDLDLSSLRTPLRASSSQDTRCPFTTNMVTVTPGMFGGGELPGETPTRFIDINNEQVSAVQGQVGSSKQPGQTTAAKKSLQLGPPAAAPLSKAPQTPSILDSLPSHLTGENDAMFDTPPAPQLTARWNLTSIPAEPAPPPTTTTCTAINNAAPPPAGVPPPTTTTCTAINNAAPPPAGVPPPSLTLGQRPVTPAFQQPVFSDTPPEPEMTARWDVRSLSAMPTAPQHLSSHISHELMEEPVRLTNRLPVQTPEEPQRLVSSSSIAPSLDHTPEMPAGLSAKVMNSKSLDFSQFLSQEMPKTPELTMSYKRYVTPSVEPPQFGRNGHLPGTAIPQDPVENDIQGHPSVGRVEQSTNFPSAHVSAPSIRPVTEAEFERHSEHMRRILPLDLVNTTLTRINGLLQDKAFRGEEVFLTEADVQQLDLRSKSKAMVLFLINVQRLYMGVVGGTSQPAYYPIY